MRKARTKLLAVASVMFFVAVLAACTSEKTDSLPPYPDLATLDPNAPTVEQILGRTRSAMNEVTSYRRRGASLDRYSTTEFSPPSRHFVEQESRDRSRVANSSRGGNFWEWITIGPRTFHRSDRETNLEWQEREPIYDRGEWRSPFDHILSNLETYKPNPAVTDGLRLIPGDEVTDDGLRVYRIEIVEISTPGYVDPERRAIGTGSSVETRTTSLLIDKDSYRLVTVTINTRYKNHFYDESGNEPLTNIEWIETLYTARYYDYDEPIIIEVPDEYVPWSESETLAPLSSLSPR